MKLLTVLTMIFISTPASAAGMQSVEPFHGAMGLPKKLFNIYNRTQINDYSAFPFRIIGQLEDGCTGTLIGPRHVLTAAHCVYNFQKKTWNENINFVPGKISEQSLPYGIIQWKRAFVMEEFIDNGTNDYDVALIETAEDIGNKIGWSGFKVLQENEFTNSVRITGYPGDRPAGTLWSVTCPSSVLKRTYNYQCDTFGGMSGSGVFSLQKDPNVFYITGVHTFGGEITNGGVILDQFNFKMVLSWRNDNVYPDNTIIHERIAVL